MNGTQGKSRDLPESPHHSLCQGLHECTVRKRRVRTESLLDLTAPRGRLDTRYHDHRCRLLRSRPMCPACRLEVNACEWTFWCVVNEWTAGVGTVRFVCVICVSRVSSVCPGSPRSFLTWEREAAGSGSQGAASSESAAGSGLLRGCGC
jgi:hypothetical protein